MPEPIVEESIEVLPSEDNGNFEPDPIAPNEPPETPSETVVPPTETPSALYELPDGRKVDGEALTQEYKNLLSDYTRKSQALASQSKETDPNTITNPLEDPDFVPSSYKELADVIRMNTLQEIESQKNAVIAERQVVEDRVTGELTELKQLYPSLDENALFVHATKYRFTDLKLAHQNMADMSELVKSVQTTTAKNIQKRNDPVSASPGAIGARPNPSQFSTAVDYLRATQGN